MIDLSITGDVAEVVLNAPPKLNALSLRELGEMDAAYRTAERAGVRALVLRAEGRAFCAGRDIAGVDPRTDDVPEHPFIRCSAHRQRADFTDEFWITGGLDVAQREQPFQRIVRRRDEPVQAGRGVVLRLHDGSYSPFLVSPSLVA